MTINTKPSSAWDRARAILASSTLASLLVAGCGGGAVGGDEVAQAALAAPQASVAATVQLQGCVLSTDWLGAADTAVHVRAADGRAVGTAFTDSRGVYAVTVPARSALVVDTAVAGPGGIALNTGNGNLTLGACLLQGL